jgi:hypothetical protein
VQNAWDLTMSMTVLVSGATGRFGGICPILLPWRRSEREHRLASKRSPWWRSVITDGDWKTGEPPFRHPVLEPSRLEPSGAEPLDGLRSENTVWTAAVGDDRRSSRQASAVELVEWHRSRPWNVSRGELLGRPHVEHQDVPTLDPPAQLASADGLQRIPGEAP